MGYIYDFDIGSILFFGLTIFFYLSQRRLRDLQDRIFTLMLIASMTAVVFDFFAGSMEYYAAVHPVWLLYAVNMLFIFGMQTCLPLFFFYAVAAAGKFNRLSGLRRGLCLLPYLSIVALLLASPFVSFGICHINQAHIYERGPLNLLLYVDTGIYIIAGIAALLINGKSVSRVKRDVILFFVVLLFGASMIQIVLPRYLVTASATALALTAVFYALQSPVDQLNPLTGAFSRTLLPELLQNHIDMGRSYTLIVVSLRSFDQFVRLYGVSFGDRLLAEYAEKLMARHKNDIVVYMDSCEFVVIRTGIMSLREAESLAESVPRSSYLVGRDLSLDICLGVVPYSVDADSRPDTATVDYMLRFMRSDTERRLIFADGEYRRACDASMRLDASIGELISGGSLRAELRPLLGFDGSVAAMEALPALPGEDAGAVTPEQLLAAVAQNGCAWDYYRALLSQLAPRAGELGGERLCLPMLTAAFVEEGLPERLRALLAEYGLGPERLIFSLEEYELASALPVLRDNIRRMGQLGFRFLVDAFAEGYTDMSLLISLPLSYARLHRSLTAAPKAQDRSADLLRGLLDILADLGITAIKP